MTEILIHGHIGFEVEPIEIQRQVAAADQSAPVRIRIHSPGGSVTAGIAMASILRAHPKGFEAVVDGEAASMAAILAISADRLSMPADAWLMFHRVSGPGGNADDQRRMAAVMEQMEEGMIARLLQTDLAESREQLLAELEKDLWLNGTAAAAAGLVDELLPAAALAACADWENRPPVFSSLDTSAENSKNALQFLLLK